MSKDTSGKRSGSLITNFFVLISLGLKAINIMALLPSITQQYDVGSVGMAVSNKIEDISGRINS